MNSVIENNLSINIPGDKKDILCKSYSQRKTHPNRKTNKLNDLNKVSD